MNRKNIGIGNWTDDYGAWRLVVEVELRVGDLAGDLAPRGFKTVEHEPCPPGALTLAVRHSVVNRRGRGIDIDSGGAGIPAEMPDTITVWDDGWNADRLRSLVELADRWHLNSMRPNCAHMILPADTSYDARRDIYCSAGSGYKYGSAWLVELLPVDVLAALAELGVEA